MLCWWKLGVENEWRFIYFFFPTAQNLTVDRKRRALLCHLKTQEPSPGYEKGNYVVEQVTDLLFKIGKNRVEFSEEQKVIGPLMKEIIQNIDNCISYHVCVFDPDIALDNLVLRSGIQFLLDNFKEFPVTNNKVLGDFLKIIQESENLEEIKEVLMTDFY